MYNFWGRYHHRSQHWFNESRIFFDVEQLAITDKASLAFGGDGVLEFVNKSEPDRNTAGKQLSRQEEFQPQMHT